MSSAQEYLYTLARQSALASLRHHLPTESILADAIAIQQIPAPTFNEHDRAGYICARFQQYPALTDIEQDALNNVVARWPGRNSAKPAVLVSAHLDTVFGQDTDLTVKHHDDRVYGPGLGDNSLGVAGLLALLDILTENEIAPASDIWFVANACEEGLGNLDGMRAVCNKLGARIGAAVVIEGMALGSIYNAGIAVRRLRIAARAQGGHSWIHFGRPSAIHGLMNVGAHITSIRPSEKPRTTYNIGMIEGGQSVNSIATQASLLLDLRSESADALHTLEQHVLAGIAASRAPGLSFDVECVGDRPAGQIPREHPLVQLAAAALRTIDHDIRCEAASTDANILLANGIPAVTVGVSHGGNAHRLDEFVEVAPIRDGIWQLLLLILSASALAEEWQRQAPIGTR